jgi:hypothetical protein
MLNDLSLKLPIQFNHSIITDWLKTEPEFTGYWLEESFDCSRGTCIHTSRSLKKIVKNDGKIIYRDEKSNYNVPSDKILQYYCRGTFQSIPSKNFVEYFYMNHPLFCNKQYIKNKMSSHRKYLPMVNIHNNEML